MGKEYQAKMKKKKKGQSENLNKPSILVLGALNHMPMTQETLNDLINTTRIAVQGVQGPQITCRKRSWRS